MMRRYRGKCRGADASPNADDRTRRGVGAAERSQAEDVLDGAQKIVMVVPIERRDTLPNHGAGEDRGDAKISAQQ